GANEQMMVGLLHHRLGDERRRSNTLQRRNTAGSLLWSVHATGIELDDSVGVRQASIANARVFGVPFDDVHAGDHGIKRIGAAIQQSKRLFDARPIAAVLESVTVAGCDDHRPYRVALDRRSLGKDTLASETNGNARESTGANEVSPTDISHRNCLPSKGEVRGTSYNAWRRCSTTWPQAAACAAASSMALPPRSNGEAGNTPSAGWWCGDNM